MRRTLTIFAALAATALLATPTAADWLVTRDGDRIATAGEWSVRDGMVVFRLVGGTLASLRTGEVDLPASRAATDRAGAEASAAPARPSIVALRQAPPASRPMLVITDADVAHVAEEEKEEETTAGEAKVGRLQVTTWQERTAPLQAEGIHLVGRLANTSSDAVLRTQLEVRLLNAAGEVIASAPADLSTTSLAPRTSANFVVAFPGIFNYSRVEFHPDGFRVEFQGGPAASVPVAGSR